MKKGTLRVVLAGLVVIFMLAACNKTKPVANEAGAVVSGPPAEIVVEVFDRGIAGVDPTRNAWVDWIQKKLLEDENIKVTFYSVPRSDEIPALNNLMAAGNPPDIAFTYSTELINNFRDLGGLYNIYPHINTLLPDLRDFLGPDPMLPGKNLIERSLDKSTNSMAYIPARRIFRGRYNTFMRKDWLDKLGLPLPQTTQQYYETLKAFKEKDPGGVGRNNVIPYTSPKQIYLRQANLLESFIDPKISDKDRWIGTVAERSFLLPGYKEGVRLLNKMYNEGLIDRDFPLYASETEANNKVISGVAGSFLANYDGAYRGVNSILSDLQKNVPGALLVPVDPFTDANGVTTKYNYDAAGMFIFIPASSKNPEAALRYLNWLARFENRYFLQLGPVGITHELVNGIPKAIPTTGEWNMVSPQNVDYNIITNGLELETPERTAQANALSYFVDPQLIITADMLANKNAKPLPVVPVILTTAGPYTRTLQDKGDVLMAEAVTCPPAQFDRVWDAGIADWLASGAQIIRDERAAKYIAP
jgi:putative aldouronate transport system substrate-binding protein